MCKIFGPKIRSCKFFDKYQVWRGEVSFWVFPGDTETCEKKGQVEFDQVSAWALLATLHSPSLVRSTSQAGKAGRGDVQDGRDTAIWTCISVSRVLSQVFLRLTILELHPALSWEIWRHTPPPFPIMSQLVSSLRQNSNSTFAWPFRIKMTSIIDSNNSFEDEDIQNAGMTPMIVVDRP